MGLADEVSIGELIPGWVPLIAAIYFVIGVPLALIVRRDAKRHRIRRGDWVASMLFLWPMMVWFHFFWFRKDPKHWRDVDQQSSDGSSSSFPD